MHTIHGENFSYLQLCKKTEKSKSKRFNNEMKIFVNFILIYFKPVFHWRKHHSIDSLHKLFLYEWSIDFKWAKQYLFSVGGLDLNSIS